MHQGALSRPFKVKMSRRPFFHSSSFGGVAAEFREEAFEARVG